eukprot:362191-Chlamydomonas_euryale.AAC.5
MRGWGELRGGVWKGREEEWRMRGQRVGGNVWKGWRGAKLLGCACVQAGSPTLCPPRLPCHNCRSCSHPQFPASNATAPPTQSTGTAQTG